MFDNLLSEEKGALMDSIRRCAWCQGTRHGQLHGRASGLWVKSWTRCTRCTRSAWRAGQPLQPPPVTQVTAADVDARYWGDPFAAAGKGCGKPLKETMARPHRSRRLSSVISQQGRSCPPASASSLVRTPGRLDQALYPVTH